MKSVSKIGLGLVLVLALAVFVQPAAAACGGTDGAFWAFDGATRVVSNPNWCGGYGCYENTVAGPLKTAITPNLSVDFWLAGSGDPVINDGAATGSGVDSGLFDRSNWMYGAGGGNDIDGYYSGSYSYVMYAGLVNWNRAGIDGCISDSNAVPNRCLCVQFSDEIDGVGYFATLGGDVAANGNTTFVSPGTIQLQPIPRLSITGSSAAGENVNLTVSLPDASGGVNDACGCAPVTYRVYSQTVNRGDLAPVDRAIGAGWTLAGEATDVLASVAVAVDCSGGPATGVDAYLGASLVFPDGYETAVVSMDSNRVECGTTLADPDSPARVRPGSDLNIRERGSRRGR
ncbi:MAG: hypothetical protein OES25_15040 [Acidobacteriota bacterium]|nr:hypothetical protein [Acidobacteriota bacterium]